MEERIARNRADPRSFLEQAREFLAGLTAYFSARGELLGIEAKEAAGSVGLAAGLGVAALFVVLLGYVLLIFGLIFLVAWLAGCGNAWIWVTFGAAVLHLAVAAALGWMAWKRLAHPLFPITLGEFRKDQTWLSGAKTNS